MKLVNKLLETVYGGVTLGGAALASNYNGEAEWFTKGYLQDVTLPFGLYFLNKLIVSPSRKNIEWFNATYAFLVCSAFEVGQGLGWYNGAFDSKDFLAYAIGSGLAVAADKLTFRKKNLDKLVEKPI